MCFKRKKKSDSQQTKDRLRQLTAVSELATTEYTIAKVIKAEEIPSWNGERKLLYSCKVYVKAGINLEGYDPKKTEIDEETKSITVTLPHAKVQSVNMPNEECELAYERTSGMRKKFTQKEKNDFLIQGEDSVRSEIANMDILVYAEHNARNIFKATLLQLGYKNIDIKFE